MICMRGMSEITILGGEYSITRSYTALLGDMHRLNIADLIWSAIAQPKHRFFMWLGAQGRVLTKDRLRKLHIQVEDGSCCLCDAGTEEDSTHLSVACSWITALRGVITAWTGVQIQDGDIRKTLESIKRNNWKQTKKEIVAAIFGSMFYHTWRARNWRMFKGVNVNIEDVVRQIKQDVIERIDTSGRSRKAHTCREFLQKITT